MTSVRPSLGRVAAGLAVYAGVMTVYWIARGADQAEEPNRRAARLSDLQRQVRAVEITAAKRDGFDREVAELKRRLELLDTILPTEPRLAELRDACQRLAGRSGLELVALTPRPGMDKELYRELPVDIQVRGPFERLSVFLDVLRRTPRLLLVTGFSVERGASGPATATVRATAYQGK